ncbi:hypothetical protein [Corynebacterium gerontici]|uniref:Daunorubicin/doxorubicin resistance ATP-binding protein DrrA n=1 Tax=Corynebacterium gerontici TaxID=2079234 RepID=A0A3G6IY64_9CORY|nr:hypothetical protein [Corynebacterium gerontici]AZA10596.1 Daunorubicin/doxorubicin resistance ATP-binding protein DrrA [Corynebacterium gerontici]
MHRPKLLILDEPTSGLDPIVQQQVLELFAQAARDGATVFLPSHILGEIEHIAEEAAVLREGSIGQTVSVAELRKAAGRQVRITFDSGDAEQLCSELQSFATDVQVREHNDQLLLSAVLQDQVAALIDYCARHHAIDLLCEEPSLEQSVLTMYQRS